jgi:hypothetical protein
MTRLFPAWLALWALALATPCYAQRVLHQVRFGDTLTSIAKEYYGDDAYAPLLAQVNGRRAKSALKAGDRLRVPTVWRYRVRRTTSVQHLAKRLLGDARRHFVLREFNQLRGSRVRAGTDITVPFVITHVAGRDESFVALAKRYYGDPTRAKLIARYNFLRDAKPPAGHEVVIPIGRVRILPLKLRDLTQRRVLGVLPDRDTRREALQEANASLRKGEYWQVPLRLIRMLSAEIPSDEFAAELMKLLASSYVALGKQELAVRAFHEALLRRPGMKLDAVLDSPKVIKAFIDAKTPNTRAR